MCEVKYIEKNLKKTSRDERKAIQKGIDKLLHKIDQYEASGVAFECIYDDSMKYDVLSNGFFVVKLQSQRLPIRLLYRYVRKSDTSFCIEIHKSYLKKHTDQQKYINIFEKYAASY